MNSEYVKIEREKLAAKGYGSAVSSVVVNIDKNIVNINIANDIYILTGIRVSKEDMADDIHTVAISSANNAVQYTQQQMASLGTAINNIFREYIIVETLTESLKDTKTFSVPRYSLEFIKITPIK